MARNEEKHFARLNRLLLERENEEKKRKHPKRPRLENLHTVDEIKMWLPHIKRDIDISLKQSQVICYPDSTVHQYQEQVVKLEREYKAFVRKIKQLKPGLSTIPWTMRGYQDKVECEETGRKCEKHFQIANKKFVPIKTPLLDTLPSSEPEPPLSCVNPHFLDKPLEFSKSQNSSKKFIDHSNKPVEFSLLSENSRRDEKYIDKATELSPSSENPRRDKDCIEKPLKFNPSSEEYGRDENCVDKQTVFKPATVTHINGKNENILGLNYSSSEDDDDDRCTFNKAHKHKFI
ncbi:uncharacterized protein LOC106458578 isoform X2 [Limulus polyphemus]|uniref:Uncharacterized protein LOC106458578 isoform X2 n=1 Tax=Limulus polyphemus TaxID=6850 RepID=A0ABM1SA99_LIMPO|nr:uncharacterized protein LOC106458578 isoform X2 [Limulus polyphemus]